MARVTDQVAGPSSVDSDSSSRSLLTELTCRVAPKPVALETRWRAAASDLKAFIERLTASLQADEEGRGLRRRARKAADEEKFTRAVEAICCNLAAVAMAFRSENDRALAVQLGSYASGNSVVYGAHFIRAMTLMEGRGLLTVTRGYRHSQRGRAASTISATPSYWKQGAPLPQRWDALSLEDHRDRLLVGSDDAGHRIPPPRDWLEQADGDMRRINEYLKSLPIAVAGYEVLPPRDMPNKLSIVLTTPHHRTVRRVFKGSINEGGRLYDGFWETMRREDRQLLTINGEHVVNVDYGQLFLRLAYARSGKMPPPGDLYDLTGWDHMRSDWRAVRAGRKKILAAILLKKSSLKQWTGGSVEERAELRRCFPPGTKPSQIVADIKERHCAVAAEWFERGRGLELHRLESDILIAILLRLIDLGVRALPLHDSVIVARSDGEVARQVMLEEARRLTGADIPVSVDGGN